MGQESKKYGVISNIIRSFIIHVVISIFCVIMAVALTAVTILLRFELPLPVIGLGLVLIVLLYAIAGYWFLVPIPGGNLASALPVSLTILAVLLILSIFGRMSLGSYGISLPQMVSDYFNTPSAFMISVLYRLLVQPDPYLPHPSFLMFISVLPPSILLYAGLSLKSAAKNCN